MEDAFGDDTEEYSGDEYISVEGISTAEVEAACATYGESLDPFTPTVELNITYYDEIDNTHMN